MNIEHKLSSRFFPTWNQNTGLQVTGLIHLIQYIYAQNENKKQIWCEIGSNVGESALIMSSFHFVEKLYCIDPLWDKEQEVGFEKRLSHLSYKIKLIRKKSSEAFDIIPNSSLDCIYIDGDHSYEGVTYDLFFALSKVKNRGFICGHDYGVSHEGVVRAVDEFMYKYDFIITKFCDSSFALLRKNSNYD